MLVEPMATGAKPPERWRIGTEHEKLVYRLVDGRAPAYAEPGGIRDLLAGLARFGWEPVEEGGQVSGKMEMLTDAAALVSPARIPTQSVPADA